MQPGFHMWQMSRLKKKVLRFFTGFPRHSLGLDQACQTGGPQLSFKLSKCLKLTYFDVERLLDLKKAGNISKLWPADSFPVFECHFAARIWG